MILSPLEALGVSAFPHYRNFYGRRVGIHGSKLKLKQQCFGALSISSYYEKSTTFR
jgi:hypothetical protein